MMPDEKEPGDVPSTEQRHDYSPNWRQKALEMAMCWVQRDEGTEALIECAAALSDWMLGGTKPERPSMKGDKAPKVGEAFIRMRVPAAGNTVAGIREFEAQADDVLRRAAAVGYPGVPFHIENREDSMTAAHGDYLRCAVRD